ncbi:uncharacterized protein METZ01_LOCUS52090 [marine metagenome]|uniref:5-guanidino-2-oxopentanoate decarboxylase n=1 Tax=marine metagenome TaxID=408172 RepID=A0A381S585_9ZZZZ
MTSRTKKQHGKTITCGEAAMRLLTKYGVDTVFGIPGVHTLDYCRELRDGPIRHIQVRNEQGAGFMADGYARAARRPGVALVISGPGVTNALTAIGQSWADSIPVLLLSSETDSSTHGKGWGALHEIPDQRAVTAQLTALSARAKSPEDVPELIGQAFGVFSSQRPRPVHISIPIDVLAQPVSEDWMAMKLPKRAQPSADDIKAAANMLRSAKRPLLMVGGGAVDASVPVRKLVELLQAPVVCSTAGKGIVPDDHPLSLNASTVRPEVQSFISTADVILAVGTELAETDSFVERLDFRGDIIRIDLDPRKLNDQYPSTIGIVADANASIQALLAEGGYKSKRQEKEIYAELEKIRQKIIENLTVSEKQHMRLLSSLADQMPDDTFYAGDICQLVYTGAFGMNVSSPGCWSYPAGYCALGCGLPNAIGAKLAQPDRPVVCLTGDGGFMFTVQELIVASEEKLGIPIIIWENGGLKQIQDDMNSRSIPLVGVEGGNPDFIRLSESMGCDGIIAESLEHATETVLSGFSKDRPTMIIIREGEKWLT